LRAQLDFDQAHDGLVVVDYEDQRLFSKQWRVSFRKAAFVE
jgi:hypothetical protein